MAFFGRAAPTDDFKSAPGRIVGGGGGGSGGGGGGGSKLKWFRNRDFFDDYRFTMAAKPDACGVEVFGCGAFGIVVACYPVADDGRVPAAAVKVCRLDYALSNRVSEEEEAAGRVPCEVEPYKSFQREMANAKEAWARVDAAVQPLLLHIMDGYMQLDNDEGIAGPGKGTATLYVVMERLPYAAPTWVATENLKKVPKLEELRTSTGTSTGILKANADLKTLAEAGALTRFEVRKVMEQVLTALAGMHACSIFHRDIKPGNVLVARRRVTDASGRAFPAVKLADFGLSRDVGVEPLNAARPPTSEIGTGNYRAPELTTRDAVVKPGLVDRTDVYAAGISWLELSRRATGDDAVAGSHVWPPLTPGIDAERRKFAGYAKSVAHDGVSLATARADGAFDDPVVELAFRMLQITPDDRPTASAVLELMRAAWPGEEPVKDVLARWSRLEAAGGAAAAAAAPESVCV